MIKYGEWIPLDECPEELLDGRKLVIFARYTAHYSSGPVIGPVTVKGVFFGSRERAGYYRDGFGYWSIDEDQGGYFPDLEVEAVLAIPPAPDGKIYK